MGQPRDTGKPCHQGSAVAIAQDDAQAGVRANGGCAEVIALRVMALDVGDRRIGVALSDPEGILASTLSVIKRTNREADLTKVADLAAQHEVGAIVVGLPTRLDGTIGEQAAKVQSLARELARKVSQPIVFWDERLTTAAAERMMIDAGFRRQKRKERIDAAAAALILQGYLDYVASSKPAREQHSEGSSC